MKKPFFIILLLLITLILYSGVFAEQAMPEDVVAPLQQGQHLPFSLGNWVRSQSLQSPTGPISPESYLPLIMNQAQINTTSSLAACSRGGFSTEVDFWMLEGEASNGDPYISDGDLLSFNGQVCARNADLLSNFYIRIPPPADLGLDAVDIFLLENDIVAFSTELDDPLGNFTAGDLLLTTGAVIPNEALVYAFDIKYDIGLDAVHFVALNDVTDLDEFVNFAEQLAPDDWINGRLQEELERYAVDIWFSTEGTHQTPVAPDMVLDGDLLSAQGFVVLGNDTLLPASAPAGIPTDGVDFGLDSATAPRLPERLQIHYSPEILHDTPSSTATNFTDGDVLRATNGIMITNQTLVMPFQPAADFLGLDALYMPIVADQQ